MLCFNNILNSFSAHTTLYHMITPYVMFDCKAIILSKGAFTSFSPDKHIFILLDLIDICFNYFQAFVPFLADPHS
jgi:hypothetical protein